MRVIAIKTIRNYWETPGRDDAEQPLKAWYAEAQKADWHSPQEIKAQYRSASIVGDSRVVFNIAGNKHRLVVKINYSFKIIYIRFIGNHKEYDLIDVTKI